MSLRDIKRRIASVKSTQKITRAMKMVAAAKLRRAQEAVTVARPYALQMRDLVNRLAHRAESQGHPLLRRSTGDKKINVIVLTGDRGLCGAFNSSVANAVSEHLRTTFAGKTVELTVIGRKGVEIFKRRDVQLRSTHTGVHEQDVHASARTIIGDVAAEFGKGETDAVYALYNRFKSAISQHVTLEQILPFTGDAGTDDTPVSDYLYEPSDAAVFNQLLTRHLEIQMHRILLESAASEHGARMTAMDSATNNAGDMIERLTLMYNRARQDAITTELIEVVSGAEAL